MLARLELVEQRARDPVESARPRRFFCTRPDERPHEEGRLLDAGFGFCLPFHGGDYDVRGAEGRGVGSRGLRLLAHEGVQLQDRAPVAGGGPFPEHLAEGGQQPALEDALRAPEIGDVLADGERFRLPLLFRQT